MKWYYFGLLSLVVCILCALWGWYIGGSDHFPQLAGAMAAALCLIFLIPGPKIFRRVFPDFSPKVRHKILCILGGILYAASAVVSEQYYLRHSTAPEISTILKGLFQ